MAERTRSWHRLTAEFFVIVVGVLVALAVASFREDRAEASLTEQHLAGLESDLLADSANFEVMGQMLDLKRSLSRP